MEKLRFQSVSIQPYIQDFARLWRGIKTVNLIMDPPAFAFWNTISHRWELESGDFKIGAGSSSRDIRREGMITASKAGHWNEIGMMKIRNW